MSNIWILILILSFGLQMITIPVSVSHNSRDIGIYDVTSVPLVSDIQIEEYQTLSQKPLHWAVVVGISDYKAIGDLRFCDEDANDWYNYLVSLGYDNIVVFGDNTSSYERYDGIASEYNVKQALLDVVTNAGERDTISFITSGHGGGDSRGNSYLCMWDFRAGEDGEDGYFWDYEVASILELALARDVFVFIDHCFAGGFGDDLMSITNSESVYLAVTCDVMGMGWDAPEYDNGLWTYFFLEYTLIETFDSDPRTDMETAFDFAASAYPYVNGAHHPQEYDGDSFNSFQLL